ncbi:MAG TPA: response regulator [Chloroflexota bacterium]|nr:response regulator [Chloroflexota bacterium]
MSRARVVILEDDVALRGLLQEVLQLEDFEVIVCDSFEQVLEAASGQRADLIVADFWGGPQRSLSDTGRQQIRELGRLLPVILVTGRTWAAEITAEELGARALIRKPFDLEDLLKAIDAGVQPGS